MYCFTSISCLCSVMIPVSILLNVIKFANISTAMLSVFETSDAVSCSISSNSFLSSREVSASTINCGWLSLGASYGDRGEESEMEWVGCIHELPATPILPSSREYAFHEQCIVGTVSLIRPMHEGDTDCRLCFCANHNTITTTR